MGKNSSHKVAIMFHAQYEEKKQKEKKKKRLEKF